MIEVNTTKHQDNLVVELSGAFTIPYKGSSKWLEELLELIDEKSI